SSSSVSLIVRLTSSRHPIPTFSLESTHCEVANAPPFPAHVCRPVRRGSCNRGQWLGFVTRQRRRIMRGQLRIARIAGIEVRLHYSWFLIAGLLTVSLAGQLYLVNPAWGPPLIWSVAVVTALAFFGALLAHELSHAAVARSRGIPVPEITLFALGGIAHMGRDAGEPETEFW